MKFVDIVDGLTVTRQTDELTGLSSIVVQDVGERQQQVKIYVQPLN